MEWMPLTNLKAKRSSHSLKSKRESRGRAAATMEGMARASSCVLGMGVRTKQIKAAGCAVKENTGGWRHEPPVISQYHCRLRCRTGSES